MTQFPCKGCPERATACSDHCEKYQAAKAQHDAEREWLRQQQKASSDAGFQLRRDSVCWVDIVKNRRIK